jgi:hypothetical protein
MDGSSSEPIKMEQAGPSHQPAPSRKRQRERSPRRSIACISCRKIKMKCVGGDESSGMPCRVSSFVFGSRYTRLILPLSVAEIITGNASGWNPREEGDRRAQPKTGPINPRSVDDRPIAQYRRARRQRGPIFRSRRPSYRRSRCLRLRLSLRLQDRIRLLRVTLHLA